MNTHKQISRIINRLPTELQGQVIIWFQRLQERYPSMTVNDLKKKKVRFGWFDVHSPRKY